MIKIKLADLAKHDTNTKLEMIDYMKEEAKVYGIGTDNYNECNNFSYIEHFSDLPKEMCVPEALLFFGITYDEILEVVKIPKWFNPIFSKQVIKTYLLLWESETPGAYDDIIRSLPIKLLYKTLDYRYHCRDNGYSTDRGFHYCGTYIQDIFEALEMEYKVNPWN